MKKFRPPSAAEKCEKKCEKFPRKYEKSPKKYKKHLKSTEKCEKKCENAKSAPSAPKSVKKSVKILAPSAPKSVNSHFKRLKKNTDPLIDTIRSACSADHQSECETSDSVRFKKIFEIFTSFISS